MVLEVVTGEWQYFPVDEIKINRNNFLVSPCGTGKTTALKKWLENNIDLRVIVVTFRISLAYMLSSTYGFENYLDFKHESAFSLAEHPRIVISVESLQKFFRARQESSPIEFELPDVLVLDEYCSIIEHAFNGKTLDPSRRSLFFTFLFSMLSLPNKTVIGADAFFDLDLDLDVFRQLHQNEDMLKMIAELDKYNIVVNNFRKKTRQIRIWQSPKHWKNYLLVTAKEAEKKIFFFVNNKTVSDAISAELTELKGKVAVETSYPVANASDCLYLSSDSSPGDLMKSSIDPNSEWKNYRFVTVTPTIQAGVSFDVEDHFDLGFGYAGLGSTQPLGVLQQLARVRNYTEDRIELCVQKQTKGVVSRTPPTIEEVIAILERKTDGFNNRYLRCCEVNYIIDTQENVIRFGLNPKSIVNVFCIRVARADYFAKQSYLTALTVLAERDSYDIQILLPRECKKITEAIVRDHKRKGRQELTDEEFNETERALQKRDLPSFQSSFPCTLKKHSIFKSEILFNEWDGCFNMCDKITDAKSYVKTKTFIKEWNILGAFGALEDLISIDEKFSIDFEITEPQYEAFTIECDYPQECAKLISFDQSHVGDFYSQFIADDRQEKFHEYITGNYRKLIQKGKSELNIGNSGNTSEALVYEFSVKLWSAMGICPMETLSERNWLGAQINKYPVLKFTNSDDADIHDKELMLIADQPYVQMMDDIINDCDCIFKEVNENRLTSVETAERVRGLFLEYWEHIYGVIVDLSYGGATRGMPACFNVECGDHNVAQTLQFIRLVSDTLRESLRYIGLKINLNSKVTTRTASIWHHQGRRVRLSKYEIEGFDERLMISYCRLVKDSGMQVHSMRHYPRPDPFRLLFSDPMGGHIFQNEICSGYRFKRYLWAHPKIMENHVTKNLQQFKAYTDFSNVRAARDNGFIEKNENIMESIFPSLNNIRYFWFLLRIGRDSAFPLDTVLHTRFIKGKTESKWYRTRSQASDIDFSNNAMDTEYMTTDTYKRTGMLRNFLFKSTDEEIRQAIERKANNKITVQFRS